MEWHPPEVSNGPIRFYTLSIYTSDIHDNIELFNNYTLTTMSYVVTGLEPFTTYVTSIKACNTKGCVSSQLLANGSIIRDVMFRSLASAPEEFAEPMLVSINSYSVQINWKVPLKPNGIVERYVLERLDFMPMLGAQIMENNYTVKQRTYKFSAEYSMFIDFENLEPCGVYGYRMFVYNQVIIYLNLRFRLFFDTFLSKLINSEVWTRFDKKFFSILLIIIHVELFLLFFKYNANKMGVTKTQK